VTREILPSLGEKQGWLSQAFASELTELGLVDGKKPQTVTGA
jgi:hypothetical protein